MVENEQYFDIIIILSGDKAKLLVASGGALRLLDPHKHEHEREREHELEGPRVASSPEIVCLTAAPVAGWWWAWWGDAWGRVRRLRLGVLPGVPGAPPDASTAQTLLQARAGEAVRGVAVDPAGRRLYWTSVARAAHGGVVGALHVAMLDGRRRVTLWTQAGAEPDDVVVSVDTGEVFWSERGAFGGVLSARLDGSGVRWALRRRTRRSTALALWAPARRLYVLDAYYGTLHSVATDGTQRATHALFRPDADAPLPPHLDKDEEGDAWQRVASRACVRMAAWEEWVWCASARGVVAVARRPHAPAAPPPHRAPASALAVLHPVLYHDLPDDPCAAPGAACPRGALCLRGAGARSCLCPDGLPAPAHENGECEISPGEAGETEAGEAGEASEAGAAGGTRAAPCELRCGAGVCALRDGAAACACPGEFAGARCQHYRCTAHCHRRGRCYAFGYNATHFGDDALPPLKCVCYAGYEGSRCQETLRAAGEARAACARCANGASCLEHDNPSDSSCLCAHGFSGENCTECAAGEAGAPCRAAAACRDHCLNNGTCSAATGAARCACAARWRGERCELPAEPAPDAADAQLPPEWGSCSEACAHGGRCVRAGAGGACACAGGWGGPRCTHYVGHDDACRALACAPPAACVWRAAADPAAAGTPYCACGAGAQCAAPVGAPGAGGAAWGAGLLAVLALLAALLAALYVVHRRRHGAFVHARLAEGAGEGLEISNPMYLAGDDDHEPHQDAPRANGNHFANPIYESMYAPEQPPEEQAALLHAAP
ncbi:platelet endothelial aggregation receptor 1-like [Maniola jurtina]|uniref:platelet endothelial aggregation receptor 1-like n=1 Tax=Maniola jurtina TaxID=191418 RepID=UPI001E68F38A|nr:platelet endothelial aggregation receptor 1-like [Maniola jurtina]